LSFHEANGQIFQTKKGGVSIITDEHEHVYYIDVSPIPTCWYKLTIQEPKPLVVPTFKAACGHALLYMDDNVTAVSDLSKDWRFAKNDIRGDYRVSKPDYHENSADIPVLCVRTSEISSS
jgi:hypothetical protein